MTDVRYDIQGGSAGTINESRSDISLGDVVEIVDVTTPAGTVSTVELLSRPVGSEAEITGTTPTWEFEPDLAGGYRIKLTVDTISITRTLKVLTAQLALDLPAHNERASEDATIADTSHLAESETNEGTRDEDRQKGWAPAMESNFKKLEAYAGRFGYVFEDVVERDTFFALYPTLLVPDLMIVIKDTSPPPTPGTRSYDFSKSFNSQYKLTAL